MKNSLIMNKSYFISHSQNLPLRLHLCYIIDLIEYFDFKFPEYGLLSDYSDLKILLKNKELQIIKFLYFNRFIIHKILYQCDIIFTINNEYVNSLADYFYIDLLVNENHFIIDYSFSFELIRKLNSFINNDNYKIKDIILSKISFDLIDNYKSSSSSLSSSVEHNFNEEEEMNKILSNNKILINKYSEINDDKNKKIDQLFIDIFNKLIINNKFEDYEYIYNIIEQLDLESINITKTMFQELKKILNDVETINNYIILDINDLFNIKKINFYYIFFKYILKNTFYIYQFSFLFKTKINILKTIKNNIYQLYLNKSNQDDIINDRIDYIISFFADSNYYYQKYVNAINIKKLNEILFYYKTFLFESKKEEISLIEKLINNKEYGAYEKYLWNYKIAKKMNDRFPIIDYLFGIKDLTEKEITINVKDWDKLENSINKKDYKNIEKEIIQKISNYIDEKDNKNEFLNIFKEDIYQTFIKENNNYLKKENEIQNLKQIIENKKNENTLSKLDVNESDSINKNLVKGIESSIIKESYEIDSKNINKESFREKKKETSIANFQISIIKEIEKENFQLFIKSSKYKIVEFIKTIGKLKIPKFIQKLSNDYFIIGGDNKKLLFYDYLYNFYMDIKLEKNVINIVEKSYEDNIIEIIACCGDIFYVISINEENRENHIEKYEIPNISNLFIFKIDLYKYIFIGGKEVSILDNLFYKDNSNIKSSKKSKIKIEKILENSFSGGIIINKNIISFTSNSIYIEGEDKIVFYNLNKKSIIIEIKGYSFISSLNGLSLINFEKNEENNKILLCACKQYNLNQKNGILLINIALNKTDKDEKFYHYFFETNNFEVYCFCQICKVDNENPINGELNKKENIKLSYTNFVFVGGFDKDKRQGSIQLFKIGHNETFNYFLEYIEDIIFENNEFSGFEGPISCICQSFLFGNIVVTSLDGNIYLFKPPNVDYFDKMNN